MSDRRAHVVVLCEDLDHYLFAYRSLVKCGWRRDQIAFRIASSEGGSGFTYVLNNYPAEVRANRAGRKTRALLVLVDADGKPEGGREKELERRLKETDQKQRQAGERIALWVPRRQVETWVRFLTDGHADEETDYKKKHQIKEREYKPAAEQLAQIIQERRALPIKVVPSLKKALLEFSRLLQVRRTSPKRLRRKR